MESQHGGTATFIQVVPVHEEHGGQTIWDGTVHVFELAHQSDGHFRAYAWSFDRPGGLRRFFAVLHGGPISGPREAVRASILAEAKTGK